jgi:hypothetical protein
MVLSDTNLNGGGMLSSIKILKKLLNVLQEFSKNYDKKLNLSKLAHVFNLNSQEIDEILILVLEFQELFGFDLLKYQLKKKIENNQIYFVAEIKNSIIKTIPTKIKITPNHLNLLSDAIYMFKKVKRGRGFAIKTNGTELLSDLKQLFEYHPYFFFINKNGLMYPSEFGLKLGELVLSYKKGNKKVEIIELNQHTIKVE